MGRPEMPHCACDYCAHLFDCDMIPQQSCPLFSPGFYWSRYLCLAHWKLIRAKKLIAVGERCELCGSTKNLHVHHLSYENIFQEELEDLQVLCCACHGRERMTRFMAKI